MSDHVLSPPGEHSRCKVVITEDKEFHNFIDRTLANANAGILVGTHSWRQQFAEALEVEDIDGGGWKELKIFGILITFKSAGHWSVFQISTYRSKITFSKLL